MLGVMPTGTGKTVVFAEIAKRLKKYSLILAYRDELIQQAAEKPRVNVASVKSASVGRDSELVEFPKRDSGVVSQLFLFPR